MGLPIDEKGGGENAIYANAMEIAVKAFDSIRYGGLGSNDIVGSLFAEGCYNFKIFELQKCVRKCCLTKYK